MAKGRKTGGRTKGSTNKLPTIRAAFEQAFKTLNKNPDEPYALAEWARENPTEFYKLAARLIPTELTGAGGAALTIQVVRFADKG